MAYLKSTEDKIKTNISVQNVLNYSMNEEKQISKTISKNLLETKIKTPESIQNVLSYAISKTNLTTTHNCWGTPEQIQQQFMLTTLLQKHQNKNNIFAHHYIQSFSPEDNVTPEQAHQIAVELMKRVAPNYQYTISTHTDRDHIHNHIILNAVNPVTGYKWHDNKSNVNHMREVNDELCRKYKLSIIAKSSNQGLNKATYQLAAKGKSWKVKLCTDLDEAIISCKSKEEFIKFMQNKGYTVSYKDVHITLTPNGEKKGIRVNTLAKQFGEKYKKENIEKSMGYHTAVSSEFRYARVKYINEKKVNQKKTQYLTEWQRYEKWNFTNQKSRSSAIDTIISSSMYTNRVDIFLLRLLCRMLINALKKSDRKKNKLYKLDKPISNKQIKSAQRLTGNIKNEELFSADGDNYFVNVDTMQLIKLSNADFFYSARMYANKPTARVLIKSYNKENLSELIGVPIDELDNRNAKEQNRTVYNKLKKLSKENNTQIEYRIIDKKQLEELQKTNIMFAVFEKGDKFNVAVLKSDISALNALLYKQTITK